MKLDSSTDLYWTRIRKGATRQVRVNGYRVHVPMKLHLCSPGHGYPLCGCAPVRDMVLEEGELESVEKCSVCIEFQHDGKCSALF